MNPKPLSALLVFLSYLLVDINTHYPFISFFFNSHQRTDCGAKERAEHHVHTAAAAADARPHPQVYSREGARQRQMNAKKYCIVFSFLFLQMYFLPPCSP